MTDRTRDHLARTVPLPRFWPGDCVEVCMWGDDWHSATIHDARLSLRSGSVEYVIQYPHGGRGIHCDEELRPAEGEGAP